MLLVMASHASQMRYLPIADLGAFFPRGYPAPSYS